MPSADAVLFAQINEVNSYYSALDYISWKLKAAQVTAAQISYKLGDASHTHTQKKIKVTLKSSLNELNVRKW